MSLLIILAIIVILIICFNKRKKLKRANVEYLFDVEHSVKTVASSNYDDSKKHKQKALEKLKKEYKYAPSTELAIDRASDTLKTFLKNHSQSEESINSLVKGLSFPEDMNDKEAFLRREINKYYKSRESVDSKAIAIYLAFEHVQLQLLNPEIDWKNHTGLQKLQSNWKSIEYFNGLIALLVAYHDSCKDYAKKEKFSSDINRAFELWNSQNISFDGYKSDLDKLEVAQSCSEKHFLLSDVIRAC